MLQQLRVASKSWVASVIIGVLVLAFALWGVADIFRGGNDTVVAEVGNATITSSDYDLAMKNQIKALSAQTQTQITMDQARAIGLDRNVLDSEITRAAVDEEDRNLGLVASRSAIVANIRNDNNFFGAGGAFDPTVYQRVLQDNGLSEAAFVVALGDSLTRAQMTGAVTDGIVAPPGLTRLLFDFTAEQRVAEYLVVTPDEAGQGPEPTTADLEAYHKAHAAEFNSPEYRAFDYVEIGPQQVADKIDVPDADIKAQYDSHKADYEKPETRDIEQIAFRSKAAADAAAAKIKTAADFANLARERGLKDADLKLGTKTALELDPRLAQPVFAVPEGGFTQPVQGPFGWVILRAAKVTPGETKSLDQVKDAIKADLIKARSASKVTDLVNTFEDVRGGGTALGDAAKKEGLPVHHVAASDRMGLTPEGAKADIPAQAKFLDQVFMTESGEESEIFQTDDGVNYAVKITAVTPPSLKPLASVREQVREGFLKEASAKRLLAKVQALAATAMKDGNLAGIGKMLARAPVTSKPMRRNQTDDVFSANFMAQIFAAAPGAVLSGPVGKGDGIVIARVVTVVHPEPDMSGAEYANFRKTASEQLGETTIDGIAAAARLKAGVKIHPATVSQVLGETAQ